MLNIWGAEGIYEQPQNEQPKPAAQTDDEKDKSLYTYLQSLWSGNSKKDNEDCKK